MATLENKIILIFGGSGSLGNKLVETYLSKNIIYNYSRDENKHWQMNMKYKSTNLRHIIGDIRDAKKVEETILRIDPHIIIVAAAMKHIDQAEFQINECLNTNVVGIQNVLDKIELHKHRFINFETLCFISTDKACSPVNAYGMTKALCESLVIEKSKYIDDFKFVAVRYGNVLNSRGSIIPILKNKGEDPDVSVFTLTDDRSTRFIMTLEESVQLIEYAILYGNSGEIIIPKLNAMYTKDLFEIFSERYNKPVIQTGLRPGEKLAEALINETQSMRTIKKEKYCHVCPSYQKMDFNEGLFEYNSNQDIVSKEQLKEYLIHLGLLDY